jgi:hypothetical protein
MQARTPCRRTHPMHSAPPGVWGACSVAQSLRVKLHWLLGCAAAAHSAWRALLTAAPRSDMLRWCAACSPRAGKQPSADTVAQRVSRLASDLKHDLFTGAGSCRVAVDTMASLMSSPEMRELMRHEYWYDRIVDAGTVLFKSDRDAIPLIIENLKGFLMVTSTSGTIDTESDNAIKVAAAALVGSSEDMKGKKKAYQRLLGLTHSRVVSAIEQRDRLNAESPPDSESTKSAGRGRWVRASRKAYSNRYGDDLKAIIDSFLHSVATPDNSSKRGSVKVLVSVDEVTGTVVYDLHAPALVPDVQTLLNQLTGRDHTLPKVYNEATDTMEHPLSSVPDKHWQLIAEANRKRKDSGKKPFKLSTKFIRECLCPCMGKAVTYKCADKRRFAFESMLALYSKARPQWHAKGGPGGVCDCGVCDCGCHDEAVKRWCASPSHALGQSMCAPKDIPEFGIPELDASNSKPTGAMGVPKFYDLQCHEGRCDDCGWGKVHKGPTVSVDVGGGVKQSVPACKVEMSSAPFSWYSWQRLANTMAPENAEDDPDYSPPAAAKTTYSTYWFPVTGTRAQFMVALHNAFVEYRSHMFWVQWHRQHFKRAQFKFLIEPAIKGWENVPGWQRDYVLAHSDFAATITVPRSAEATGSFAQTSQMFTSVLTHDPRMQLVADLPGGTFKSRLKKAGVVTYPTASTTVLFAMSNANNDAQYYASVLTQAIEVLHTGAAPAGSKMEFIHDGIRLKGSNTDTPLNRDLNLVDFDDAKQLRRRSSSRVTAARVWLPLKAMASHSRCRPAVLCRPGGRARSCLSSETDARPNSKAYIRFCFTLCLKGSRASCCATCAVKPKMARVLPTGSRGWCRKDPVLWHCRVTIQAMRLEGCWRWSPHSASGRACQESSSRNSLRRPTTCIASRGLRMAVPLPTSGRGVGTRGPAKITSTSWRRGRGPPPLRAVPTVTAASSPT